MLVQPQKIIMKWNRNSKYREWYTSKGYVFTNIHDEFEVDVLDLPLKSTKLISYSCDYCNEIYTIRYSAYNIKKETNLIKSDCCKECAKIKTTESNLIKYGKEHVLQVDNIRNSEKRRISSEIIFKEFADRDYTIVDFNYKNNQSKITYTCNKHVDKGYQYISYNKLKQGQGCIYCSNEKNFPKRRKYTIDSAKEHFLKLGLLLLEEEYVSVNMKMKYICIKHPSKFQYTSLGKVIQGHGCKYCGVEKVSGENSSLWKGGITPINHKIRNSEKYRLWRIHVFERDNYTCQCCGDNTGGNLNAHHIENFSDHHDKRFDVENGMTLCNDCHNPNVKGSFHHTYGTKNNNREQLEHYILNHRNKHYKRPLQDTEVISL